MSAVQRSGYGLVRLALASVGVLVLVVAVTSASSVSPLATAIGIALERGGSDYVVAAALGFFAVLVAAAVFVSGRAATLRQTAMPTVERPVPVRSAGESFDETITSWRYATPIIGRPAREDVRERLRSAAVVAVAAADGLSAEDARRLVDEGTWTDDAVAASFLAGDPTAIGTWIDALGEGETGPAYRARRAVDAIVARRAHVGGRGREDGRRR